MLAVLLGFRDEHRRMCCTLMAGAAGDRIRRWGICQLLKIGGIDLIGHRDHDTGAILHRIRVRGEVIAASGWILGVAKFAFDAQIAFVLTHELDDRVASHVF